MNSISIVQLLGSYIGSKGMNIGWIFLMIFTVVSCKDKSDDLGSSEEPIVYIKGAEKLHEKVVELERDGASLTLDFVGAFTEIEDQLKGAPKEIDLNFKVDASLVEAYNTKNGTSYVSIPVAATNIGTSTAKIAKGEKETSELLVTVDLSGLSSFVEYLLPVTIADATGGLKIDERKRTMYYKILIMDNAPVRIKVGVLTNTSGNFDVMKVANIVNPEDPDVVVVCEMDKNTTRSTNRDMSDLMKDQFTNLKNFRFVKGQALQGGEFGLSIFSRYPITKFTQVTLAGGDTRPLGIVELDVHGQTLAVAGIHITHEANNQVNQVNQALGQLSGITHPLVLAGHLQENRDPHQATTIYPKLLEAGFVLPCETCGRTYNASPTVTTQGGWTYGMLYKTEKRFDVIDYKVSILPGPPTGLTLHHPIFTTLDVYFRGDKD